MSFVNAAESTQPYGFILATHDNTACPNADGALCSCTRSSRRSRPGSSGNRRCASTSKVGWYDVIFCRCCFSTGCTAGCCCCSQAAAAKHGPTALMRREHKWCFRTKQVLTSAGAAPACPAPCLDSISSLTVPLSADGPDCAMSSLSCPQVSPSRLHAGLSVSLAPVHSRSTSRATGAASEAAADGGAADKCASPAALRQPSSLRK